MKVCETCGVEIGGRDGVDNRCSDCDGKLRVSRKRRAARRARDEVMRSLGMVKVRGALGGTYWE